MRVIPLSLPMTGKPPRGNYPFALPIYPRFFSLTFWGLIAQWKMPPEWGWMCKRCWKFLTVRDL